MARALIFKFGAAGNDLQIASAETIMPIASGCNSAYFAAQVDRIAMKAKARSLAPPGELVRRRKGDEARVGFLIGGFGPRRSDEA